MSERSGGHTAGFPRPRRWRLADAISVGLLLIPACVGGGTRGVDSPLAGGFDLSPRFAPDGSRIVFSSDRSGNDEIYVIGVDGTGLTRLTSSPAKDLDPSFSPDGSKIVFDSDRDGPVAIFAMDVDGSDPVNLSKPKQPGDIFPSWSPDGSKIVYACGPSFEGLDICVMDARGANTTRLTESSGADASPSWSPDGTRIAFHREIGEASHIFLIDVDDAISAS